MSYSITPILTGVRNPDQGIMTYQQGYGKRIWLPIWAFLLQGKDHTIMVDTGLDENELITPPGFKEETGMEPVTLREGLQQEGLVPDDVDIVINTHLHDDHCGNNGLFNKAVFYVHEAEVKFCKNPHPIDHRYDDYFIEGLEFTYVTDGQQIVSGVKVLHSPGHTMGGLSVIVKTGEGNVVITGFCCNRKNFPENGPAVCPGVHLDAVAAWESIQRIRQLGMTILPMHDLLLKKISG
ncbi:N-acyl homoserine lactonase family protein [Desulforhopalus singaporensis]|uniref:N-acyl homoserine lactonase family protein n=1 Tax=Desulforhopalus singaporensis TaxID=91360 RepID=UPI0015A48D2B|nr:N-acyl homoserine lactonase family protein [Desulforhopalus singaporensis]